MFYLGIDWGTKKIGLALGSNETKIATPFGVVKNFEEVLGVIQKEGIGAIVLGRPLRLGGEAGNMEKHFQEFKIRLETDAYIQKNKIQIYLFDERFSTKAANKLPGERKEKAQDDAIAAMLILEDFYLLSCRT